MDAHTADTDNPLEAAASQMRHLRLSESLPPLLNQGSLGRMLIHIENIARSVVVSTTDHLNAAKRLKDFALVFARVAGNTASSDGSLAHRLTAVSENLRAASEQLSRADSIPAWHAAEHSSR